MQSLWGVICPVKIFKVYKPVSAIQGYSPYAGTAVCPLVIVYSLLQVSLPTLSGFSVGVCSVRHGQLVQLRDHAGR